MNLFLLSFLVILVIKFAWNLSRYIECKNLLQKYNQYIKNPSFQFAQEISRIVELFKGAGLQNGIVPVVKDVGFGQLQSFNAPLFENIMNTRGDVIGLIQTTFYQAIGVYRSRTLETFNPLYWIETIIYLPRRSLEYLGFSSESKISKFAQFIYWFIVTIATVLYSVFEQDIVKVIRACLNLPN